ncbi:hypothetical protein BGW80DRAFT_765165 [Lactifluus volemus]|nr:hypothetical protein BGW80DRAFT_765165 [Lactifluus volemus]
MLGADQDGPAWHKALRWCPRSLLEIINSRACRGAIMFNDTLSLEQCERLMSQLAETAFPFQCAHGRPSLVPLAGTSECASGKGRRPKVDWARGGSELALSSGDGGWGISSARAGSGSSAHMVGEPVTSPLPRNNIRGAGAAES